MLVQIRPRVPAELVSVLELEDKPAILLDRDYRILATNAAYQRHYDTTVEIGHDRCFRVSHGYDSPCDQNDEACPLASALSTGRASRVFHVHHGPEGPEHVDVELRPIRDEDGEIAFFIERIDPLEEASASIDGEFVGRAKAFTRAVEMIHRAAVAEVPVLLRGESGTGKELAARAVHQASAHREGPFVPVECSGLAPNLFESELFGHEQGAFTGATKAKAGLVEAAKCGTLFLDEIGDVPLELQVKLLRLLESGTYRRVGDTRPRRAEFRLVLATHRPLEQLMQRGEFRQDLYYRISVFPIELPPLRDRKDDIPLLAERILKHMGTKKRLGSDAVHVLMQYDFPGNVRELRNILERAALLCDDDEIGVACLPGIDPVGGQPTGGSNNGPRTIRPLREVEAEYLAWAAANFDGERRELAAKLGLSERTLYRKLRETKG